MVDAPGKSRLFPPRGAWQGAREGRYEAVRCSRNQPFVPEARRRQPWRAVWDRAKMSILQRAGRQPDPTTIRWGRAARVRNLSPNRPNAHSLQYRGRARGSAVQFLATMGSLDRGPRGTTENSPVLECWVWGRETGKSRQGRQKRGRGISVVPAGTWLAPTPTRPGSAGMLSAALRSTARSCAPAPAPPRRGFHRGWASAPCRKAETPAAPRPTI